MIIAMMLQTVGRHIGFAGTSGPLAIALALIFWVVVISISFKIFRLLLPKLGVDETWVTILYWVFVLLTFILVFTYVFGYFG